MLPIVILGLLFGGLAAIASRKKGEGPALPESSPTKALPPSVALAIGQPKIVSRTPRAGAHASRVKKSAEDLMMAAIQHANVTKDPRDYRAAAGLALKAGKPKTSAELAKIADQQAGKVAVAASHVLKKASVTGDPRAYETFANLAVQIDQTGPAARARRAAKAIREGVA